jgi:hypothetical protein
MQSQVAKWLVKKELKDYGRKNYHGISLDGIEKTTKESIRIAELRVQD